MKIKKLLFSARTKQTNAEATGDLILRVFAGLTMALAHGWGKVPPSEQFVQGVGALGFPAPSMFAWFATFGELGGGLLLALGLATRAGSFLLAFTMLVAAFGAHAADPFQKKEMALLYMVIAIHYVLAGAGRFSADAFLNKR